MIVRKLIKEKLGLCNDLDNGGKPNTAPTLQRKSLKIPSNTAPTLQRKSLKIPYH